MKDKNKDKQASNWQLTINNPIEKGFDHTTIFSTIFQNFKTVLYVCLADEQGNTFHTHVFICFSSRVRFSKLKRYFPEAHIEACKGKISDNINYVKKAGKWKSTEKGETSIDGTFEERGTPPPDSRGKRNDMSELYQMVSEGMSNTEILAENQDYILQIDKLDKIRTILLMDRYKNEFRDNLEVIYIYGKTGTGKTYNTLKQNSDVFRVTDYAHPFDNYACESVLIFDEFRESLILSEMLNYCDIYPIELKARYANKYACYNKVYIISNWELEKQYETEQEKDKVSWEAFLRRINKVIFYQSREKQIIYNSVKDYFASKNNFEVAKNTPFDR